MGTICRVFEGLRGFPEVLACFGFFTGLPPLPLPPEGSL